MATNNNKVTKGRTKSEMFQALADKTGLTRKQVAAVYEELTNLVQNDLGKKGPGVVTLPGLLKLKVVKKPATKARKGINPFTKLEQIFKAKPARNVVKALPLKNLKDTVK